MAVTNDFHSSELDLNDVTSITSPTAIAWGPDGRLYVGEVKGDVKVLTVAFGDKSPSDPSNQAGFYVTAAETVGLVKSIPNFNDDGSPADSDVRQISGGIDVVPQFDETGAPVIIDGQQAVVVYVASSDSRIGAGEDGDDSGLDTNSGIVTRLVQTETGWEATDIVRGIARSEENHAANGLEVVQELDDAGNLVSERMILASGGNANTGAPSNNFAGQQETIYSAALLEIDLDQLREIEAADGVKTNNGRAYVYDLPTLDDPARPGPDDGGDDPFGGADGVNGGKLDPDGPVQIYSAGYRNAFDVEVTEDGRVFTYDNGANDSWGGRPAGEDTDSDSTNAETGTPPGYVATNLFVEDNNEITGNFNPQNWDQLHEATRSDDLGGRTLSAGAGGPQLYEFEHPDHGTLTLVYGGHPNPSRAEGARAGLLYTPEGGVSGAKLMVSNVDDGTGSSDFLEVVDWLSSIGYSAQFIEDTVVAVEPGVRYADQFVQGYSVPTTPGAFSLVPNSNGPVGLPADIQDIVTVTNPVEGNYLEGGYTDGAIDSGKGSINGLAEYTSTILDGNGIDMSGALIASSLNQGQHYIIGRDGAGVVQTDEAEDGRTIAADRAFLTASGGPLGLETIGDDLTPFGGNKAFQGTLWAATFNESDVKIEVFQPGNPDTNPVLGQGFYAGQVPADPEDFDLDGVDHLNDPFEFDADNGYDLAAGQALVLDFDQLNDRFPNTIGDTGILGAALDGVTPNRDAKTGTTLFDGGNFGDGFPASEQEPGLYDNGGNLIPGANAPLLQIKQVQQGTAIGAADSAREAMHTGVKLTDDVARLVAELDVVNWIPNAFAADGRVTGLSLGDGTQQNFVRLVFGDVDGGTPGLEVRLEVGNASQVLATVTDPAFVAALTTGANPQLKIVTLRLEVADIGGAYELGASYKVTGEASFTEIDLGGAALPVGVLRDVLDGTHTISDGDTTLPSGAAVGVVAEKGSAASFPSVDFANLRIQGVGNEIDADTAAGVGAPGGPGLDTVVYTGTDTDLAPLDDEVENFDGSASAADYTVTGNAKFNVIEVGPGANTIVTGAGEDVVRGTLDDLDGDTVADFTTEDTVLVEGLTLADTTDAGAGGIAFSAGPGGSAVISINGAQITLDGPGLEGFDPADGPAQISLTDTEEGLAIGLVPDETIVYRVNAGGAQPGTPGSGTIAAIDGGPDWIDDGPLVNGPGPVTVTGTVANTFSSPQTDGAGDVDYDNVDPAVAPWQLFVNERSDNSNEGLPLAYNFDVQAGETYRIEVFYTENWPDIFEAPDRIFDIAVEGGVPEAFNDLHPLAEAAAFVGAAAPTINDGPTSVENQFLGVARKAEFEYTAGDDLLTLEFLHGQPPGSSVENPKVSAIQITQLGGTPVGDMAGPQVQSIEVANPQGAQDGPRALTVVLSDETGFDAADFAGMGGADLTITGIVPDAVSDPEVTLSDGGKTATLVYQLTGPGNVWPSGVGEVSIAAGAFEDAAGNASAAASAAFVIEPNLAGLERGSVVRAVNLGTTDPAPAAGLDPDQVEGGVDDNRYGGSIAADSLILDAFGNPVSFEADQGGFHTSPKSNNALNNNVDGALGETGSNAGGVDLDGSAYHTYRDSAAGSWTSTYGGFENGTYVVELHLAELFHGSAGQRVGDFTVNGVTFAENHDAFAEAEGGPGADTPSVLRQAVTVTDGTIQVDVSSDAGQAGYAAIVVYEAVDGSDVPAISVGDLTVAEGVGAAEVVFSRAGPLDEAVTVDFTVTPATAQAADLGTPIPAQVVIPVGQATATALVPIVDDEAEEGPETVTIQIDQVSGDAEIQDGQAVLTIAASDGSTGVPGGATILELDFETAGDPIGAGGFDGVLGGAGALEPDAAIEGGKLVVQTSDGDLSQPLGTASKNDFVTAVDLADPALETVLIRTAFDNPFTAAAGFEGPTVADYAQLGLVVADDASATNQDAGQFVKLVFGGNGGLAVQVWSQTAGLEQKALVTNSNGTVGAIADAAAAPFGLADIARVELALEIDKAAGTTAQYTTFLDASGVVLGGTRPVATPGFLTVAPTDLPEDVAAAIADGSSVVGVTSSDYLGTESFEASWDFLTVTSPQAGAGGGPVASITGDATVEEGASATYTVALSEAPTEETTVTVTVAGAAVDPASLPGDAELASGGGEVTLTFAPGGATEQTVAVEALDDALPELAEGFVVSIGGVATAPGASSVATTIAANDGPVDGVDGTPAEGGDFSDDGAAPTEIGTLALGETTIVASQQGDDAPGGRERDYVTFTVAEGQVLSGIVLEDWNVTPGGPQAPQAFLGLQDGGQILVDPTSPGVPAGNGSFASPLKGGVIYNEGSVENAASGNDGDLLPLLADGEEQGVFFDGGPFATPLPAGTYTLWFNQGNELSTATVRLVTAAAGDGVVLSIADAPAVLEAEGAALAFGLTATDGFEGTLAVSYDAAGATGLTQEVAFAAGSGTLLVPVADDEADDGDDVVSVTLTGASDTAATEPMAVTIGAAQASGTVIEDDGPDPIDKGDLVLAINAGGAAIAADPILGVAFSADEQFPGSTNTFADSASDGSGDNAALDGSVYETERWAKDFTYALTQRGDGTPLVDGESYVLELHFTELFLAAPGKRVFDVVVNGELVADDFVPGVDDPSTAALEGIDVVQVPVTVQGGQIAVRLNAKANVGGGDNAKISALALYEAAPVSGSAEVGVSDATAGEADGAATVTFTRTGDTTEAVEITYATADGGATAGSDYTAAAGTVVIAAGATSATVAIPVADDAETEGEETFVVTITSATAATTQVSVAAPSATVTIADDDFTAGTAPGEDLDDDGVANAVDGDVDGDGVPNGEETFSYDATDAGTALAAGQTVRLEFDADGTPFQNGLTGVLDSPKADVTELDLDAASVSGGTLDIAVGAGDHFGNTNTQQNAFVAAYTAPEGLSVETRFAIPDYDPQTPGVQAPGDFQASGVVIGLDQDNLVKAVYGRNGSEFELAQDNVGNADTTPGGTTTPAGAAEVAIRLQVAVVDPDGPDGPEAPAPVASMFYTFYDAAGAVIGAAEQPGPVLVLQDSADGTTVTLASAILAGDPIGAGVIQTSTGGSSPDGFEVSYQYLEVTALGAPSGDAVVSLGAGPTVVEAGDEGTTTAVAFDLATTGPDGTVAVSFAVDGGAPQTAEVAFQGGAGQIVLELPNDDLADGRVVELVLTGVGAGAVLGAATTATATIEEDDVAPAADQPIAAQSVAAGAPFEFAVPNEAFSDGDSALVTVTDATLAGGAPLPEGLTFSGGAFSGSILEEGVYTIELTASDGTNTGTTSFELTVGEAANAEPTTSPIDLGSVPETADPIVVDLLLNAADTDGGTLAVDPDSVVALDGGGEPVAVALDGASLTVDPGAIAEFVEVGEAGSITVTYDILDGQGGSVEGQVVLEVTGVDDDTIWYLDADADGFGDDAAPVLTQADQPDGYAGQGGDLDDSDASIFPGAPELNDGKDNDQDGETDEANAAPVAGADAAQTPANQVLVLPLASLLTNDEDPDLANPANGDVLSVAEVGPAVGGTVELDLDAGVVRFTPTAGAGEEASFAYTLSDGFGGTATGSVSVTLTEPQVGLQDAPIVFGAADPVSYATDGSRGQDRTGPEGIAVADGEAGDVGQTVTLSGNAWKSVGLASDLVIPEGAVLRFDYLAPDRISEIAAIGFDDDSLVQTGAALFQIGGTQTYTLADQGARQSLAAGVEASFEIALDDLAGQSFDRLVLINDQDKGAAGSGGVFSNIRIAVPAGTNLDPVAQDDTAAGTAQAGQPFVIDAADLLSNDDDPEGGALTVTAVSEPSTGTVTLSGGQITFTPAAGFEGTATFAYTVSDGDGGLARGTVSVAVGDGGGGAPDDVTPVVFSAGAIQSYDDQDTTPGGGFAVEGGGTGVTLFGNTWKKIALPAGVTIEDDTQLRLTLSRNEGGTGEIVGIGLETDDEWDTDGDAIFQLAGRQNFSVGASRVAFDPIEVGETRQVTLELGAFAGTAFTDLVLLLDDDAQASANYTFSDVQIVQPGEGDGTGGGGGQPPVIVGGTLPDETVLEDALFELALPITDPDTPAGELDFVYAGLPEFVSADGGFLTGTPTDDDVGTYTIGVTVGDGEGSVAGTFDLVVENVNDAPEVVGALPDRTAVLGAAASLALPGGVFVDVDAGDALSYEAEGLPAGLSIDPATGTIGGTPTAAGVSQVTVTATDLDGESASTTFELTVSSGPPREEIVIEGEDFDTLQGYAVEFAGTASGDNVVRVANGQSAGTASTDLDAAGIVSGTYDLAVRHYDETDGEATLRVLIDRGDGAPELLGEFTLDQTGLPGQGTFLQAGNLTEVVVPGVTVGSGARLILEGEVEGGEFARVDLVRFTPVDAPEGPVVPDQALSAAENQAAAGTVAASGAGIAFAVTGGADAAAFAIDPDTGALSFAQAPDFEAPADADGDGVYDVEVTATDAAGSDAGSVAVTVTDVNEAPQGTAPGTQTVALGQPVSLPALDALFADPDAGDALAFEVDQLPAGVSLGADGVSLEGTPTQAGTTVVTVTATDGDGLSDTVEFAVTVGSGGAVGGLGLGDDLDGDLVLNAEDGDIDGDGTANLDDRAAYDADDAGPAISQGAITLDFAGLADGTTPFEAGFTGVAQTAGGAPELDYATNDGAEVSDGRLVFQTTDPDTNDGERAFTFLAGVDDDFTFEGTFDNPVFGAGGGLQSFSQYGLIVSLTGTPGASTGQDGDFLKLVTGNPGNGFELSGRGSVSGPDLKVAYPAGVGPTSFAQVRLTLEADVSANEVTGSYELLDEAGAVLATGTVGTLTPTGALADVLSGASSVQPAFGVTSTDVGGGGSFEVSVESLSLSDGIAQPPVQPTDALAILGAAEGVDADGSYGPGAQGAVTLSVLAGQEDVQKSNFGSNSFVLENSGDKEVAAVFLDFRDAIYGDSVVDFDGSGGDLTAKPFAINSGAGATGAVVETVDGQANALGLEESYLLPGDPPLPNTTGTGIASSGGFRGLLLRFDGSDGGFAPGESVGFAGDMDPNSIAGLNKGGANGVDPGSGWDVGGVSGAELIGSSFTVLFDDGSTATGFLGSDGSQAGSVGEAVEDRAASEVSLTVDGASSQGTYGGSVPEIVVSGAPGTEVRVTLSKGLNPVVNDNNGVAALVADRLQASSPEFPVNNAGDFQVAQVTIPASGSVTLPADAFDYNAPDEDGSQFDGFATAPIVVAASAVDGQNPVGPVERVYLTSNGTPVPDDDGGDGGDGGGGGGGGGAPTEGYFEIVGSGADARFKVQVESENGSGGANPGGKWVYETAADAEGNQSGFQGAGYYRFGASDSLDIQGVQGDEILEYTIFVPEGETGVYDLELRVARDGAPRNDLQNDLWLNFKHAEDEGPGDIEEFLVIGGNTEPEPVSQGFVKVFGGPNNGNWGDANRFDGDPGNPAVSLEIEEAGLYTVQIAGRSQGYHVDSFELYKGSEPSANASDSPFVEGEPDMGGGDGGGGDGGGGGGGGAGGDTLVIPIDASTDDDEIFGSFTSDDLEIGPNNGQEGTVGLRFDGVTIPQGATIEAAFLRFEADRTDAAPADFLIEIEGSEAAATYSLGSTPDDRSYADAFLWQDVEDWTAGQTYDTPDIAALVTQVVGSDGIEDGALAFRISAAPGNAGGRSAFSFDSDGDAPELVIVLAGDDGL